MPAEFGRSGTPDAGGRRAWLKSPCAGGGSRNALIVESVPQITGTGIARRDPSDRYCYGIHSAISLGFVRLARVFTRPQRLKRFSVAYPLHAHENRFKSAWQRCACIRPCGSIA